MIESSEPRPASVEDGDAETAWLDFLILVSCGKRRILLGTIGFALVGLVVCLLVPNQYRATATFLAPQQQSSLASALLSQAGGAGLLGSAAASSLGLKSSGDLYVTLLKSRYVEDAILERFKLQSVYRKKRLSDARRKLESRSTISTSKDGVITVSVEDDDASRAADMANAYVERLQALTSELAITEAARRRKVFEVQIEKTKTALAQAESDMNQLQKSTGLLQPDTQARAIIGTLATLRAQIAAKQVEAGVLRSYETGENPELARVEQEIAGMQGQLEQFERKQNAGNGDIQIPTSGVPDTELEYLRRLREVKLQEALYELLMKQYEAARIDEAREGTLVQVIDTAVPPDKKSFPRLWIFTLCAATAGLFVSLFLLILADARRRACQRPVFRERLAMLAQSLKWTT